jgi:hypothetical protein
MFGCRKRHGKGTEKAPKRHGRDNACVVGGWLFVTHELPFVFGVALVVLFFHALSPTSFCFPDGSGARKGFALDYRYTPFVVDPIGPMAEVFGLFPYFGWCEFSYVDFWCCHQSIACQSYSSCLVFCSMILSRCRLAFLMAPPRVIVSPCAMISCFQPPHWLSNLVVSSLYLQP